MFRYEYVTIKQERKVFKQRNFLNYRDVINEYAKKGFRFVGFVPKVEAGYASLVEIDLVFEIEE